MKKIFLTILSFGIISSTFADEGMWMLPLIKKLNIQKMNGMGLSLTADDIYSENNVSLKDAVVIFGGGCTGIMVSDKGLVFTNHHCGYDAIQKSSSVEHNYLKDGFTAKNAEDEIPCPGLSVKFLVRIEDVTQQVTSQLPDTLLGEQREDKKDSICRAIAKEARKGTKLETKVSSFYSGNEFYLFVYEEFTDVRFAYAPPASIGKFGGDTDNWMWPRHTGDFSVFRVYSSPDGKPAAYSKNNVPYSPKRFATISMKGYEPNDFTMIMGNPGTTSRYLSSWGVDNRMKTSNQARIDMRGVKQEAWMSFMKKNEAINLAYASKYARSSNYWKNSIGMNKAIAKLGVIQRKQEQQEAFTAWVNKNQERSKKYKKVLAGLDESYRAIFPYERAISYLRETMIGIELPMIAQSINRLLKKELPQDSLLKEVEKQYKDYYPEVDQAAMIAVLEKYKQSVDADALPEFYLLIQKKFKNDIAKYARFVFEKSDFASFEKISKAIRKGETNFDNDPAIVVNNEFNKTLNLIRSDTYNKASEKLIDYQRLYQKGLMEMAEEQGKALSPNANSTMRLTYGKVGGYRPADAATYNYYTTTKGILEKEIPGDMEFDVDPKLKKAIQRNDFGAYIDQKTGEMHVAFLSNNDITGGNSGSPIFNAKGELLGLAFDGNWEAMSGDIVFEPDLQRCINVDIRYILFVMDKVGKANRLIDELKISK